MKYLNLKKSYTKIGQNHVKYHVFTQNFDPQKVLDKNEIQNRRSFLMMLLTFLCDEYIDLSKLSEQKIPFEYIVPPPTSGVGTKSKFIKTKFSKNI